MAGLQVPRGNLQFAGITAPEVTRWDVAAAGTVVPFAAFNEKAIVTVRGSNYYATFEFSTSRHATGNAVSTPLLVSANNCNPLTKFKIAKQRGSFPDDSGKQHHYHRLSVGKYAG